MTGLPGACVLWLNGLRECLLRGASLSELSGLSVWYMYKRDYLEGGIRRVLRGIKLSLLLMFVNDPSALCLHNLGPVLPSIDSTCHLFTSKRQGSVFKLASWVNSWLLEIAKETPYFISHTNFTTQTTWETLTLFLPINHTNDCFPVQNGSCLFTFNLNGPALKVS